jgi:signal transduction histidine kinase
MDALWPQNESDLLAGFRFRTAEAARNAAWITLLGVAALTLPHHSLTSLARHEVIWLLLAFAAVGNLATYLPSFARLLRRGVWPFYAWICLLLLFDALVVFLSHDAEHEVYLIYLPVLLFAVAILDPWPAFAVLALASASAVSAMAVGGDVSRDVVVGSGFAFAVVWVLGLYFSGAQRGEIVRTAAERARAVARGRELEVLNQHADQLNQRLQRAVAGVIRAQERERRRIGRDLHDDAVQTLSSASMRLGALEERLDGTATDPALRTGIAEVRGMLIDALWEIRKLIVALRPSDLDDLGLGPALSAYARSRLDDAGVLLDVEISPRTLGRLPGDIETAVFRIAQEAVNNIARHAHADHAQITISQAGGVLNLRVMDNGLGFAPDGIRPRANGEGLGIEGMTERATLVGGTLRVCSRPGGGTSVLLSVPLTRELEAS